MSLRVPRALPFLPHLPKRIRLIAVTFLGLMAVLTMLSETGKVSAIGERTKSSSQLATQLAKDLAADDVMLDRTDLKDGAGIADPGKTAKIVTCPRCRLNALPLVKKFVYEHAKLFEPQLKVDFIIGEDPVLYLYENGKQVSEIPLDSYDWKKIIQKLVKFGIEPKEQTAEVKQALQDV